MFRFCVRFNKNGQLTQNRRPIEIVGPSLAGALTVADLRAPLRSLTPGPPAGENLAFALAARAGPQAVLIFSPLLTAGPQAVI